MNPISSHPANIPIIDIRSLVEQQANTQKVASEIRRACRNFGFFYIVGHGISEDLQNRLEQLSQAFFAQAEASKMQIKMSLGGRAWRGYFPVGEELTSGKPDLKEGIYFGTELEDKDPRVRAALPLHGANLFPHNLPHFKPIVLEYIEALTQLGHHLMRGLSLSLGLEEHYFNKNYTQDPLCLFRIFHYPSSKYSEQAEPQWGVGEHTDYGLLTILKQDDTGGLQIKSKSGWIDAPVLPNAFVCNIGDMLDRLTKGLYRSTPHRVLNKSNKSRLSYPFFFDPNFDAVLQPIDLQNVQLLKDDKHSRWDGASVHEFEGTYGDYILKKVGKVFPNLKTKY